MLKEALEVSYGCVLNVGWGYEIMLNTGDMDNPLGYDLEYYYGIHHDTLLTSTGQLTERHIKNGVDCDTLTHIPIKDIDSIKFKEYGIKYDHTN